jgi:hypothetical protein
METTSKTDSLRSEVHRPVGRWQVDDRLSGDTPAGAWRRLSGRLMPARGTPLYSLARSILQLRGYFRVSAPDVYSTRWRGPGDGI